MSSTNDDNQEDNIIDEPEVSKEDKKVELFSFDQLTSPLKENVARIGWDKALLVQERIIPLMLQGKDLVVQSRTGSGKTGAFALPLCMQVDPRRDEAQALILVPTRELAEQVNSVVSELIKGTGIRSIAVYGGVSYGPQIQAFKDKAHIVVATPGRIIDHLTSRRVSFTRLRFLVFDEADEMLSMGFYKSIIKILSYVPDKRKTTLFSATVPPGVATLANRFTRNPEKISLSQDSLHVENVDHTYYVVEAMYKDRALLKLIEMENPEAALIFCNTKKEVEYLGVFLQNFGYDGDFLSSDLSQKERERVMVRIRAGRLRFLVATDVAARGIDINDLGYVILYSLPQAYDHYIHRAGRTGRAGEGGAAISLVAPMEEPELKKRARHHGLNLVKMELPTDEELENRVTQRMLVMLEEKHRNLPNLEKERLARFVPISKKFTESGEYDEIMAMLFDQFYQDSIHKPLYPREEIQKENKPRNDRQRQRSPRNSKGDSRGRKRSYKKGKSR